MGFGFNLLFTFLLVPLTIILLMAWLLTKKNGYGKVAGAIWLGIGALVIISITISATMTKKVLKKEDFYGQYIVDRNYFPGKQADWQYDNFRFEIKENDSIYLYVTNQDKIVKTYSGTVSSLKPYTSARLVVNMPEPKHHIFESNPTIYRNTWSFYLVFNSPVFGNMFFKKGHWNAR